MTASLPPTTHVGAVRLQVSSLAQSLDFYSGLLGFSEIGRNGGVVRLGAGGGRALVELVEIPNTRPIHARARLGLFHFAILVPDRVSLASAFVHLHERGIRLGMSDHLVSEALYLSDPDGLGIEIYRDRPRAEWPRIGSELQMATDPLDVPGLLATPGAAPWRGMPQGTTIGHMHLHVGDLGEAERFYGGVIGFDMVTRRYPGALFMSAGGYHHHIGLNTWARGAPPPGPEDAQLMHWELNVGTAAAVAVVAERARQSALSVELPADGQAILRDPWGTATKVVAA